MWDWMVPAGGAETNLFLWSRTFKPTFNAISIAFFLLFCFSLFVFVFCIFHVLTENIWPACRLTHLRSLLLTDEISLLELLHTTSVWHVQIRVSVFSLLWDSAEVQIFPQPLHWGSIGPSPQWGSVERSVTFRTLLGSAGMGLRGSRKTLTLG